MGKLVRIFGIILAFFGLIFIAAAPFGGDLETDIIAVVIGIFLLGGGIYEIVRGGKSVAKVIHSEPPPVEVRDRETPQNRVSIPDHAPTVIYQKEIQKEIIMLPCKFCGNLNRLGLDKHWGSCGAPIK